MYTNVNGICHFSNYRCNIEELLMVVGENVHFARSIVF